MTWSNQPQQVSAAPKMAAAASGSAYRRCPPTALTSAPEVEVVPEVGGRSRCLETAGATSPWRPGRSLSGTRVIGGNESGMGPGRLGDLDYGPRAFARARETGPPRRA